MAKKNALILFLNYVQYSALTSSETIRKLTAVKRKNFVLYKFDYSSCVKISTI